MSYKIDMARARTVRGLALAGLLLLASGCYKTILAGPVSVEPQPGDREREPEDTDHRAGLDERAEAEARVEALTESPSD